MTVDESPHNAPDPVGMRTRSWLWPVSVIAALWIMAGAYVLSTSEEQPADTRQEAMRMPAGKPLLEPDRPDLIGDPGIANEENNQGAIPDD